ncbi:hypothetical protein Hypma_004563 [Hypsizygus marmoreus]|uniref:Uncharacterized protein n=1 Tax=Hypsizygus marmoreus TaxID=39966 RepID=A0A369JXU4_HYPMA|nr:hypothetical protein Hypma_004563 [Hypsizygus marmoreus]
MVQMNSALALSVLAVGSHFSAATAMSEGTASLGSRQFNDNALHTRTVDDLASELVARWLAHEVRDVSNHALYPRAPKEPVKKPAKPRPDVPKPYLEGLIDPKIDPKLRNGKGTIRDPHVKVTRDLHDILFARAGDAKDPTIKEAEKKPEKKVQPFKDVPHRIGRINPKLLDGKYVKGPIVRDPRLKVARDLQDILFARAGGGQDAHN